MECVAYYCDNCHDPDAVRLRKHIEHLADYPVKGDYEDTWYEVDLCDNCLCEIAARLYRMHPDDLNLTLHSDTAIEKFLATIPIRDAKHLMLMQFNGREMKGKWF